MKTINIEIPDGKEAKWVDGVLTLVDEQPKDITDRIKTFDDAKEWCLTNGQGKLVKEFDAYLLSDSTIEISSDILAYFKLRIITCALNEGWEPDFWNESEYKYWPWMYTLTEDEYNRLDEDEKKRTHVPCCR